MTGINSIGIKMSEQRDIIIQGLYDLQQRSLLTDAILNVRGKEFPAHKAVLVSGSTFFERLFLSGYRESGQEKIPIDYDPIIFEVIFKKIYGVPDPPGLLGLVLTPAEVKIKGALIYFGVKSFKPEEYIRSIQIEPELFKEYLQLVNLVYPDGIPGDIIDHIASTIHGSEQMQRDTSQFIRIPPPDLSEYSDDLIMALLTSSSYHPRSISEIWDLIKGLVEKGHSRDLLTLINYDRFPPLTPEFLRLYNKGGPLPRLTPTNELKRGNGILLITEIPTVTQNPNMFKTKFMDGSGRTWVGYIQHSQMTKHLPTLGDIIQARLEVRSSDPDAATEPQPPVATTQPVLPPVAIPRGGVRRFLPPAIEGLSVPGILPPAGISYMTIQVGLPIIEEIRAYDWRYL